MREINIGDRVSFHYEPEGRTRQGTVKSAGPKRIHVLSGDEGTYISPSEIIAVETPDDDELPLLGERFRFHGGIGQTR